MTLEMTLEMFLEELQKTPRTWRFHGNSIRTADAEGNGKYCPLTILTGHLHTTEWRQAARELGIGLSMARDIVNAADIKYWPTSARNRYELRQRLLEACGLPAEIYDTVPHNVIGSL